MNPSKKAKWMIGIAGVSFSAFVLTQIGYTEPSTNINDPVQPNIVIDESISEREKKLISLDWENFESVPVKEYKSDRKTRHS